jgi:hypothetical protein
MDTETIRAKSVEMFKKERYTSVVANNLAMPAPIPVEAGESRRMTPSRTDGKLVLSRCPSSANLLHLQGDALVYGSRRAEL